MLARVSDRINAVTREIIAAAIRVHRALGPGLLESVYMVCLVFELRRMGFKLELQKPVRVVYEGITLDCGYRIDVIVADLVVLELKAIEKLAPIHDAQMLTYLKLTGYPVGLLINFNVRMLKEGIRRLLNPRPADRFR